MGPLADGSAGRAGRRAAGTGHLTADRAPAPPGPAADPNFPPTGEATREEGQIALGSAQLMLLPIAHEHRGGEEVKQLLDLVLARWGAFPDRTGFHAREFLRNAFAAVGDDRDRIAQPSALVPSDATSELRFNMAGAYAIAGDKPAMLRALEAALAAGATAAQVRRDPDLARFIDDPAMIARRSRRSPSTSIVTSHRSARRSTRSSARCESSASRAG